MPSYTYKSNIPAKVPKCQYPNLFWNLFDNIVELEQFDKVSFDLLFNVFIKTPFYKHNLLKEKS